MSQGPRYKNEMDGFLSQSMNKLIGDKCPDCGGSGFESDAEALRKCASFKDGPYGRSYFTEDGREIPVTTAGTPCRTCRGR